MAVIPNAIIPKENVISCLRVSIQQIITTIYKIPIKAKFEKSRLRARLAVAKIIVKRKSINAINGNGFLLSRIISTSKLGKGYIRG
ncbi:MAG TPA: hypothetical protein ENI19_03175 [Candidatus Nealsonbacteria bacterium]|nr:hypothetical protein [Candidatus Nealsonbacteria bacterium]HEB46681.1 hypothetical protein [Candidatus Nealsonbacteria bacterium]